MSTLHGMSLTYHHHLHRRHHPTPCLLHVPCDASACTFSSDLYPSNDPCAPPFHVGTQAKNIMLDITIIIYTCKAYMA